MRGISRLTNYYILKNNQSWQVIIIETTNHQSKTTSLGKLSLLKQQITNQPNNNDKFYTRMATPGSHCDQNRKSTINQTTGQMIYMKNYLWSADLQKEMVD